MEKFRIKMTKEEIEEMKENQMFFDDIVEEDGYVYGFYVEDSVGNPFIVGDTIICGADDTDIEFWMPVKDRNRIEYEDGGLINHEVQKLRFKALVPNDKKVYVEGYYVGGEIPLIVSGDIEIDSDYAFFEYKCHVLENTEREI